MKSNKKLEITGKFSLRLIQGNKVLYESPSEGDTFTSESKDPKDLAQGLADAINNAKFPGSRYFKATVKI